MLLKSEFKELISFMEYEGKRIGLSQENIDQIKINKMFGIRFSFPGHTSQLELIRLITKKVASYVENFEEEDLDDIGLAIDEACTNVITHSYLPKQTNQSIQVEYVIESEALRITIVDEGEKGQEFNLDELTPVDKEAYLKTLSRGGLGVHIIKKIMDEVEYTVSPGVHNSLKITKYVRKS